MDDADHRAKQFDDVIFNKGVFQNEFHLSASPVLGNWKICVKNQETKTTIKVFAVAEYTLPKFEVSIDTNPDVNFKDGVIRVTVKAKYTFGKIFKGIATVEAFDHFSNLQVLKSIEVNGKKPIEFDIVKELGISETKHEQTVKLHATFIEEITKRKHFSKTEVTIHPTPFKIDLETSSKKFKTELPFELTAIVKKHEKNAPVHDTKDLVEFTVKYHCKTASTFQQEPTNYDGIEYAFPQSVSLPVHESLEEHLQVKTFTAPVVAGISKITIEIPSNTLSIEVTAKYSDTISCVKIISKAETYSGQFIKIIPLGAFQVTSEPIQIKVLATHALTKLNMLATAGGDVVASQSFDVPNSKEYLMEIMPTESMVGSAHILVFYITEHGEIISDSVQIELGRKIKNQINIELSKPVAKPGEMLKISVTSNPGSFVVLLGVDQSVLNLKEGNDFGQSEVQSELEKYNEMKCSVTESSMNKSKMVYEDFEKAGFVIITNLNKPRKILSFAQKNFLVLFL